MKKILTILVFITASIKVAHAESIRFERNIESKINKLIFKINDSSSEKSKKYFEKKLESLLKKVKTKKMNIIFPRI